MARVQLALNVSDLDEAIDFYSKLFRTTPAKVRPGYANFAVDDPPLKLVLWAGCSPTPSPGSPPRRHRASSGRRSSGGFSPSG